MAFRINKKKLTVTAAGKSMEKLVESSSLPQDGSDTCLGSCAPNPYSSIPFSSSMTSDRDYSGLQLKKDHERRPIWVTPKGHVFLETFSPIYKQAYDFLIAISDPVCRPRHIHEYKITPYSLYAAASLGLQTADIVSGLERLSKTELSESLKVMIEDRTRRCGKVKLCLKKNRYFVESIYPEVLDLLLGFPEIREARVDLMERRMPTPPPDIVSVKKLAELEEKWKATEIPLTRDDETGYIISQQGGVDGLVLQGTKDGTIDQNAAMGLSAEDIASGTTKNTPVYSFEIDSKKVEQVRRVANENHYPMLEEYDFRRDNSSLDLPINLKPSTQIRPYQEKSLSKMFGNGRARSGIIVLPCGAGKTLVGITAAATVKKSTLVFCTTGVAVDQWRRQFLKWTSLPSKYVRMFTSMVKDKFLTDAKVIITTYTMVAYNGKRSAQAEEVMKVITSQEWGLIVLDEVHVAPAQMFRNCVNLTHSRCKIGLTATLVREDNLIDDLYFLVGPKLYEANWLDLQQAGHLATVQCVEVWCNMTSEFYMAYLNEKQLKQRLLYVMNPNKFRACEYLIRVHEQRGDKVLVFSDNVFAIKKYAHMLKRPFIYGGTGDAERIEFLHHFQHDPDMNCLFISKIGDNSIDLPDVNVIIQIASHFSSRRQEAQRLGRILRPKSAAHGRFNAFFYTLVSKDTKEMLYASKRQRFLVDQGYAFHVLTELPGMEDTTDLCFSSPESQAELLAEVLGADESEGKTETIDEDGITYTAAPDVDGRGTLSVSRKRGTASSLSGGADHVYAEFDRTSSTSKKPKAVLKEGRNALFATREKQKLEAARAYRKMNK